MAAKNFVKLEAQNCDDSNMSSISNRSDNLSNCSDDDSSNISVGSRPNSPPASSLNQQAASTNDGPTPIKRPRLNFSIESIMKSAGKLVNRAASSHRRNSSPHSNNSSNNPNNNHTSNNIDNQAPSGYSHKPERQEPDCHYRTSSSSESRLSQVECVLDNKDMWDKFHSLNTEMIITKTGRRMFPVMKVQFHNLDPNARYAVSMDIVPVDNKRYRYAYHKSCWQVAGKADPSADPRLYPHPDSPFNGDLLSRQVISFEKVKLTNNEMDKSGHIILNSMHKYQPRVHLIELKVPPTTSATQHVNTIHTPTTSSRSSHHHHHQHHHHHHSQQPQQQAPQLDIEGYRTFVFPETVFTAVTAYQNQLITKMKIDKNPFAKGFRDSSRLSDLDRNDPFDYMGSLGPSGRFPGQPGGPGGPLDAAAAAAAGAHMDAYQLFASAANNPWYSAAALAAAAGGANPFNSISAPCNAAANQQQQAAQLQTQMWLAALSACLNGGPGAAGALGGPPRAPSGGGLPMPQTSLAASLAGSAAEMLAASLPGPLPHRVTPPEQGGGAGGGHDHGGPDSSSGGSSSSIANSRGTSST